MSEASRVRRSTISWLVLAIGALLSDGCRASASSSCGDLVCPAGRVCVPSLDRCVLETQRAPCEGIPNSTPCRFAGEPGECLQGFCLPSICGDGIKSSDEACDDGNVADRDGCSATCESTEVCGNGIVDLELGETCDCGIADTPLPPACPGPNNNTRDALCLTTCQTPSCGDGVQSLGEDCDDYVSATCEDFGFSRGEVTCDGNCRFDTGNCEGYCGDLVVDENEICDGAEPADRNCLDFGYDFGALGCSVACVGDVAGCGQFKRPSDTSELEANAAAIWRRQDGTFVLAGPDGLYEFRDAEWVLVAAGTFRDVDGLGNTGYAVGDAGRVLVFVDDWQEVGGAKDDLVDVCPFDGGAIMVGPTEALEVYEDALVPLEVPAVEPGAFQEYSCGVVGDEHFVSWAEKAWSRRGVDGAWKRVYVPALTISLRTDGAGTLFAETFRDLKQRNQDGSWSVAHDNRRARPGRWRDAELFVEPSRIALRTPLYQGTLRDIGDAPPFSDGGWKGLSMRAGGPALAETRIEDEEPPQSRVYSLTDNLVLETNETAPVWLLDTGTFAGGDIPLESGPGSLAIDAVWANENRALAVGATGIAEKKGTSPWRMVSDSDRPLNDVHAPFAVGDDGLVLRDTAEGWRPVNAGVTRDLFGLWVSENGEAMAVGRGGAVTLFRGDRWTSLDTGFFTDFYDVWKIPDGDWLVVGDNGTVLSFDGVEWKLHPTPTTESLRAVRGDGPVRVLIGGRAGTALYRDGERWRPLRLPIRETIDAVDVGQGRLLFAGESAAISILAPSFLKR